MSCVRWRQMGSFTEFEVLVTLRGSTTARIGTDRSLQRRSDLIRRSDEGSARLDFHCWPHRRTSRKLTPCLGPSLGVNSSKLCFSLGPGFSSHTQASKPWNHRREQRFHLTLSLRGRVTWIEMPGATALENSPIGAPQGRPSPGSGCGRLASHSWSWRCRSMRSGRSAGPSGRCPPSS